MSSVADTFVRLAGRLGTGKVSDAEFYAAFSTSEAYVQKFGLEVLKNAIGTHDPVLVELGLYVGHRFGFIEGHLELLMSLAGSDWHTQHENVVGGLAELRSPSSIETLYRTALARHEYLDYDEAFALGVKCVWALGGIESEDAVARLCSLLTCGNAVVEANARDQLRRIQNEGSMVLRGAAARALGSARVGP